MQCILPSRDALVDDDAEMVATMEVTREIAKYLILIFRDNADHLVDALGIRCEYGHRNCRANFVAKPGYIA